MRGARKLHKISQAVILCGGYGSRLGNLTKKIPKPLLPVNQKSFLTYLIEYLDRYKFKRYFFYVIIKKNYSINLKTN